MSIQREERPTGVKYVARVYDPTRKSRRREKTFDRLRDAQAWESQVTLKKRQGSLSDLDAGTETFNEFRETWWTQYAEVHLAAKTRKEYKRLLDTYLVPEFGTLQLRQIRPKMVSAWAERLLSKGTGSQSVRKLMSLLQGMLERAVEWERLQANPLKVVRKPRVSRTVYPKPLAPKEVEAIRARLGVRDATLVSVLAYAGLRPGEALALTWEDIGEQSIQVTKALSLGETKETKTGVTRTVILFSSLKEDLLVWKLQSGLRSGLVFPNRKGGPWTESSYRNWRRRNWKPVSNVRPYDLRHSFASLLFSEGRNPALIAEQLGHSVQTLLSNYIHIIEELRDQPATPADELIRKGRKREGAPLAEAR